MKTLEYITRTFFSPILSWGALFLIRLYQLTFSPAKQFLFGPSAACRFYPSCSDYASECLKQHGLCYSVYLVGKRLLKCGPWHPGGVDKVPVTKKSPPIKWEIIPTLRQFWGTVRKYNLDCKRID